MTTRALIKDSHRGHDAARASLLDNATSGVLAGSEVRALIEPLIKRMPDGSRRQSVRVVGLDLQVAQRIEITRPGGERVSVEFVAGPEGSTRLLIPAVSDPVPIELTVPGEAGALRLDLTPQREWTIHLVHHSHLDIGYTDPQGSVIAEHIGFLDSCLELTKATDGWPDDARFRWAVESLWSFDQWRQVRPKERVDEFIERVRGGHIELTAMPYNLHTDTCSTDELHELLRLARDVQNEYGITLTSAMQTDVPGTVAGLPDALAQLDIRYLAVAHNWAGRSVPHLTGGAKLPRLFRWRAPSGNSVLVWVTDSPHGLAYMEGPILGFDTSFEMVDDLLPAYLTSLSTNPYPFPGHIFGWSLPENGGEREPYPWDVLHLRVQGHFADNAPPRLVMAETVRQWNETWEYPRLRMSRNEDFFADAEERLGEEIQTFEGDWGDWWVDGVGSGARPQGLTRRAQAQVTRAQTMSNMARLLGGQGVADEPGRSKDVYGAISLFNEHTWGAGAPWSDGDVGMHSGEQQWHWKYACALRAIDAADAFADDATSRLSAQLPQQQDTLATFYAVNTSAWSRSSTVSLFLRESKVPLDVAVMVRDGRSGKALPLEITAQVNKNHRNAGRFLHVVVDDVPPLGMVRLDVDLGEGPDEHSAEHDGDVWVLANEHLRVQVDPARACLASIVDVGSGRELVNQDATVGFNGYVYDTYTTVGGTPLASGVVTVSDKLEFLGSRTLGRPAALVSRENTSTEQRLTYEYTAQGVRWVRVTLRLPYGGSVLFVENRLSKPATMTKESAFIAFPFAADEPIVRYEISGAATGPGLDHVPGAPQHMRAVRSWVSFDGSDGPIAWATREAPLVHPETIALPYAPFPDSTVPREPATVYSWVHNNIWDTNFPAQQNFEMSFHYAIGVPSAGEAPSGVGLAMRTADELTNPLCGVDAGGSAQADPPAERQLITLDDDRVRLVSVVAAPDQPRQLPRSSTGSAWPMSSNSAVVVRLQSFAEEPVQVRLRPSVSVSVAALATYLGDPLERLPITPDGIEVTIPRLGSAGIRLDLSEGGT